MREIKLSPQLFKLILFFAELSKCKKSQPHWLALLIV